MRQVSIVIPVYNSQDSLRELHARINEAQRDSQFEIILVDDGSRDRSWEVIEELSRQDSRVCGIRLSRNFGQHNALLCGIRAARYEIIATLDDDLQNPPEEINRLIDKYEEGFDVVYGKPEIEQHGFLRDLASQVTKLALQTAMGVDIARQASAFRVFRTTLRDTFADYHSPYLCIDILLTWGTTRFAAIPVRHDKRQTGVSNYTFRKLIVHALNMLTGFSTLPLQFASLIGFGFTLFGILALLFVLSRYIINGGSIPGFAFLASIIAIFSGAQLFALGIIGEYLARMHLRIMGRPVYAVRTTTSDTAGPMAANPVR